MTATYDGERIKPAPLAILRLLARRVENDGDNKVLVRDMMDETGMSRGSIYNYLNNTLKPLGLAGVTATESTAGAASDAKYWGITQDGYNWIASLDPSDLPATEASGEAVKRADRAVEIATEARSTADTVDNRIDSLTDRTGQLERDTETALTAVDEIESDLDAVDAKIERTQAVVAEPDQTLARDIRRLSDDITALSDRLWRLDIATRGHPDDDTDHGLTGDLRISVEALNESYDEQQRQIRLLKAVATGAVILALVAIVLALL